MYIYLCHAWVIYIIVVISLIINDPFESLYANKTSSLIACWRLVTAMGLYGNIEVVFTSKTLMSNMIRMQLQAGDDNKTIYNYIGAKQITHV